ncbi:MAG: type II toxin-antitoxin system VapC family toxin [Beijerinckiaceae bacterium]
MFLPDVNIFINAFRRDAAYHTLCKTWLDDIANSDAGLAVSPLALSAVVRVVTNRRSFQNPSPLEEAFAFCATVRGLENSTRVEPGPGHWRIFQSLCVDNNIRGPLVTDAWYAALAIEWNCELVSLDRDFARFPGLRWSVPSA